MKKIVMGKTLLGNIHILFMVAVLDKFNSIMHFVFSMPFLYG